MLTLLEAAKPELDLSNRTKSFVIPQDTVQLIWTTPDLVRSYHYRPSLRTNLLKRLSLLTNLEGIEFKNLTESLSVIKNGGSELSWTPSPSLSMDSQKKILDAAIDYTDFKFYAEIQKETDKRKIKNQLLQQRSRIDLVSEDLKIPTPEDNLPHQAHSSRRLGFGPRLTSDHETQFAFQYKFALHEFLDLATGYPDYAQITFGDLSLHYSDKNKSIDLDKFIIFEVISLNPFVQFFRTPSWRIKFSVERNIEPEFRNIQRLHLSGGPGITYSWLANDSLSTYFGFKFHASQPLWGIDKNLSVGYGPNLLFRYRQNKSFTYLFESWNYQNFRQNSSWIKQNSAVAQWSYQHDRGLRMQITDSAENTSFGVDWLYYY